MKSTRQIADEFDAIAAALARSPRREVLSPAERSLLQHVPASATRGIDVGCGDGMLTRALARRGIKMIGIDVSPQMIAVARERSEAALDVDYLVGDIMALDLPSHAFDVVITVNMVHHVQLDTIVARLAELVAANGTLLIQDVVDRPGLRYVAQNAAAVIQRQLRRFREPTHFTRTLGELYERHGAGEVYLTPDQADAMYTSMLPGARVEHLLEWRYSMVWVAAERTESSSSGHEARALPSS